MKSLVYIIIAITCANIEIHAASKIFTGTGLFSDPTKWNGGTLPVAGDDITINGTCTFDNAANNLSYGALVVGGSSVGVLNWSTSSTNTLNVSSVLSNFNGANNINMTNGGFLQIRTSWNTFRQTFTAGTGTIIWNITTGNTTLPAGIATYYNLISDVNANTLNLGTNTTINNNLTIQTGTVLTSGQNLTCSNVLSITGCLSDNSTGGNNIFKDVIINSGGSIYNTKNETYTISGNFTMLGGNLNTSANNIRPVFNISGNLLITSGTNNMGGARVTVAGTTSISATLNVTSTSGAKILNDLIVSSTGNLNVSVSESWTIRGNITVNGIFNANLAVYTLTGAGKTISGTTNPITFDDITCTGTYTNNASVKLTTSLKGTGTWSQGTTGILDLGITNGNFSITNFNASAIGNTVKYTLAGNQSIRQPNDGSYYNLTTAGSGTKSLIANIIINGDLTLTAATLDPTTLNYNITLGGNWSNTGGIFTTRTASVTLNNTSGTQTVQRTAAAENFFNLVISNAGTKSLLSAITASNVTITGGIFAANSNSISLTGNWLNTGGTFNGGTGIVIFNGTVAQTIIKTTGSETFNNIQFINAGAKSLLSSISGNNLTINSGSNLSAGTFSIDLIGNWINNGGTFTPGTGTVIFSGNSAQSLSKTGGETFNHLIFSNAGTKTFGSIITTNGNFTINSGATVDISASNFQTNIKGNYSNSGSFVTRTGMVQFNGTTAQTIGGSSITDFYDVTLNNTAGASLLTAQNLNNALTLTNGTFGANGFLTMISNAGNTARIAPIAATANITGNVTVQRYAPGGTTGWALLGTPISSGLTLQDWNDDFAISCSGCPNGSAGGFISVYTYDETAAGSYSASTGYIPMSGITDPITPNKGYWVYLGTGFTTTSPITIDVTGSVRKFNNSIPLTKTNTGSVADDGWNLIHNPYPSPISWAALRNGNTSVDNAIYTYNADLNGGAGGSASYVNGVSSPAFGSGGIGDNIPMCQGFYVHCTASTNLTAQESNKVAANPTFLKTNNTVNTPPLFRLTMKRGNYKDETVVYLDNNATSGFDSEYDAIKMAGQDPYAPSIRQLAGNNELHINGINLSVNNFSVPILATTGYNGSYTISLQDFNNFPQNACINLHDNVLGTNTDLRTNNYVFNLTSTTTTARFILSITLNPLTINSNITQPVCSDINAGEIVVSGTNAGPWNYIWSDITGTVVKTSLNKSTPDTLKNIGGGDYTVNIHTVGQCDENNTTFNINSVVLPDAQFTSVDTLDLAINQTATFSNNSTNAQSFNWNFGDNAGTSTMVDPSYAYPSTGTYSVLLVATSSSGCTDSIVKTIVVVNNVTTGINQSLNNSNIIIKNLDDKHYVIDYKSTEPYSVYVTDNSGRLIKDYGKQSSNSTNVDLNNLSTGIYYINLSQAADLKVFKVLVK